MWEIGKIPLTAFTAALSATLLTGNYEPLISPSSSSSSSYTRDSQRMFTLKNDPQCGLIAGGTGCLLDCDEKNVEYKYYGDPACLFDCVNYPMCVQQLFGDYKDQGRIGRNE